MVVTNPYAHDPEVAAIIAQGNARVLAARFHDARHFYAEDRKVRLESRFHALEGMGWIRKGGTMADKSHPAGGAGRLPRRSLRGGRHHGGAGGPALQDRSGHLDGG
ncbi:MAG: glycine--tRNA ligase subunit beta [Planctomycetes bacterium]|nr:glycine--tRNA ligase subunit beta [Planctomycetota bacterium]